MMQAIETYLNEHVLKTPVKVAAINENKDAYKRGFEISVEGEDEKEPR